MAHGLWAKPGEKPQAEPGVAELSPGWQSRAQGGRVKPRVAELSPGLYTDPQVKGQPQGSWGGGAKGPAEPLP